MNVLNYMPNNEVFVILSLKRNIFFISNKKTLFLLHFNKKKFAMLQNNQYYNQQQQAPIQDYYGTMRTQVYDRKKTYLNIKAYKSLKILFISIH